MFRFEEYIWLYFLILIPIGLIFLWLYLRWKSGLLNNSERFTVLKRLIPEWSLRKEWIKGLIGLLAILLLIIAAANPQWGSRKEKVKTKSSDIVIALDISQSMMAEDVSPNRMERAKRFTSALIKKLRGERIGLIFFAGGAYLQMPLSSDHASADLFIKSASPRQAGTQGTVIADALDLSSKLFDEDSPTQRAMIIISDGENHEQEAINAAEKAFQNGTTVFTLGIGTEEGAYVPFIDRGKKVYKKDKNGNPVSSALNVGLLQDIAQQGGGEFYTIDHAMTALSSLKSQLDKLEKKEVEQRSFTDYNSFFQYLLFPAIILLVIEYLMNNKKWGLGSIKSLLGIKKER